MKFCPGFFLASHSDAFLRMMSSSGSFLPLPQPSSPPFVAAGGCEGRSLGAVREEREKSLTFPPLTQEIGNRTKFLPFLPCLHPSHPRTLPSPTLPFSWSKPTHPPSLFHLFLYGIETVWNKKVLYTFPPWKLVGKPLSSVGEGLRERKVLALLPPSFLFRMRRKKERRGGSSSQRFVAK